MIFETEMNPGGIGSIHYQNEMNSENIQYFGLENCDGEF